MENEYWDKTLEFANRILNRRKELKDEEVAMWLKDDEHERLIDHSALLNRSLSSQVFIDLREEEKRRLTKRINAKRRRILSGISVAASIIMIVGFFAIFSQQDNGVETSIENNAIQPGKYQARLILPSGEQLLLNRESKIIDNYELFALRIDSVMGLIYSSTPDSDQHIKENVLNTLVIPRGGEFSIVLSDGTKVWVNAVTKLTYPVYFNDEKREVYLDGEAYFEVASTGKPFDVLSGDVRIRVYGTRFNVKVKQEEECVQTVLLEGSVGVKVGENDEILLVPGQKAETFADGHTDLSIVDTYRYTAWMKGFFVFENMTLREISRELSKWYNVDFIFTNRDIADEQIMASFSKDLPFDEMLSMLEIIGRAKFKQEGRIIYVE